VCLLVFETLCWCVCVYENDYDFAVVLTENTTIKGTIKHVILNILFLCALLRGKRDFYRLVSCFLSLHTHTHKIIY